MPITPDYQSPIETPREALKPDYYTVKIVDIEGEVKPSPFKDDQGNPMPDVHQFKIKLETLDKEPGRQLMTWVKDSLFVSKKAKNPGLSLPALLKATTGRAFTREELTSDFLNSLIGLELRVATTLVDRPDGTQMAKVMTFHSK